MTEGLRSLATYSARHGSHRSKRRRTERNDDEEGPPEVKQATTKSLNGWWLEAYGPMTVPRVV